MDPGVENKIGLLIEGFKIDPKVLKGLLIASGAGALGAGLDLYLGGHTDLKDFVKPMTAWGAAGLAGGVGALDKTDDKTEKNKEIK